MEKHNAPVTEKPDTTLLMAYLRDTVSLQEKATVENWMEADEANRKEMMQLASIFYAQHTRSRIAARDSLKAYGDVCGRIRKHRLYRRLTRWSIAAACVAGVAILSSLITLWRENTPAVVPRLVTVEANAGMRVRLELPDGTTAHLNAGSVLTYPAFYTGKERNVSLEGEGYFRVKPDADRPFIVCVAGDKMRIRVLGTEFNVQAYEGEESFETTLVTGKISLEWEGKHGHRSVHTLEPAEKAVYRPASGEAIFRKVDPCYDISWIEGKLVFKDHPFPEVLRKLAYFYQVRFDVKDPVIDTYRFTGIFENRPLSQVLDYLRFSSGIDYKVHETTDDTGGKKYTVVTLWRKK